MRISNFILILSVVLCCVSLGHSEEVGHSAVISGFEGDVVVKVGGSEYGTPASNGMVINEGDVIETGVNSKAYLKLGGLEGEESVIEVQENSNLYFAELVKDESKKTQSTLLDLAIGKVLIKAEKLRSEKSKFEIKTPTSITGIRGTHFSVLVEAIEQN